ncbi:MAG: phosphoribosylanthranilate isomerase [Thermodesulfobacteriota bacterium]
MKNISSTKIKICGITNMEDAQAAADYGADALGFIFYKESKRYVDPQVAKSIISSLPPFITTVGVFVNQGMDEISQIKEATGIQVAQLHGDETPEFVSSLPIDVIKVIRVKDKSDLDKVAQYSAQAILFDTYSDKEYGGTGESFDWEILNNLSSEKKVILSGGLNPENVLEAVQIVRPYAVDVSSGVEDTPGKKDHTKIKKFIEAIKNGH